MVALFHEICKSYPVVRTLSDARRKAINARLKNYSLEEIRTVFENAESSSFLKGKNERNWSANFDWLISDKNMAKVLDGQYADKRGGNNKVPGWSGFEAGNAELEAIRRAMEF